VNLKLGKVIGIIGYIFGIIIILFGLIWLGWAMSLPMLFAGEYIIVGIIIIVIGAALIYLAHKSYKQLKKVS
jgi:ABC-type antimicrobial peptide transport system permease subunit